MTGWEYEVLDQRLKETKELAIGTSRALRDLQRSPGAEPRGKTKPRPADTLVRAACSELLRRSTATTSGPRFNETASEVAQRVYGGDSDVLAYIEKAAVSPASTMAPGFASELVSTSVADFLTTAEAPSAFARLASRCLSVGVGGSIKIPSRSHPLVLAGSWIGEGAPKAVFAIPLSPVTLTPSKLAALVTFSEELSRASTPAIEAVVRNSLAHDLGALLDTTLLDATAATSVRPAGLFASATSVTPSTATPLSDAMLADLGALAAAVSNGAPDARPVFVANGKQGLRLQAAGFGDDVIISNFMAAGSVGAVDVGSIVMMVGGITFAASISATVHSSDPALPAGVPGSPNVVSAPLTSLFQQDLVGLRAHLFASWAKRRLTGAAALCTGVSW